MNNNVTISIDSVSEKFKAHLNLKGNSRIIFSGRYGTGKTRFLNTFFKNNKDSYNLISISPAKYVVSNNEDIFDLIKVDIILQLSQNRTLNLTKSKNEFDKVSIEWFIAQHPSHFLKFLSKVASKIDLPEPKMNSVKNITTELISSFIDLNEKYKLYVTEVKNKLKTEEDKLNEFVNSFTETNGNIFELNFITTAIQEQLAKAKKGKSKKENILVIDDLDRVDPEHIFRILNILSAHNDYWGAENKFGFDKIILVCDIDNIRKIYEHRYGQVDFEGYIDKFYTTDYFRFDNRDAIKIFLASKPEIGLMEDEIAFLSIFLEPFINARILTLRQIVKALQPISINNFKVDEVNLSELKFRNKISPFTDYTVAYFESKNIQFLRLLRLLISVFGDFATFKRSLNMFSNNRTLIVEEGLGDALNLLTIPYNLATNIDFAKCFSNTADINIHTLNFPNYKINIYRHPEVVLLGRRYRIQLTWDSDNKYTGKCCYFKNACAIEIHQESVNNYFSDFIAAIEKIVAYLEKQGSLSKMGVGANA